MSRWSVFGYLMKHSPACFIYIYILLHLSLPRRQLCVFLYVWVLSCFQVRASKAVPAMKRASQQGNQGEKRGRGKRSFPPLPVSIQPRPIPFLSSSACRPKCCSRSSYSLTWKERVPHTCKKTLSCLRSRLINYTWHVVRIDLWNPLWLNLRD